MNSGPPLMLVTPSVLSGMGLQELLQKLISMVFEVTAKEPSVNGILGHGSNAQDIFWVFQISYSESFTTTV